MALLYSIYNMKVFDCFWEQENLGRKTVEILIERTDSFDEMVLKQLTRGYQYVVVKVPMNMPTFNYGLTGMGFVCVENQMNVGISLKDFDFHKVIHLLDDTSFQVVEGRCDLDTVLTSIKPGMFSTDRISLDTYFGQDIGCQRYINWIVSEFERGNATLVKMFYKNRHVGFMLFKTNDKTINLLLNGLYNEYQGQGMGLLTPASPMLYVKKSSLDISEELTSISSNNIPVVKLYNRLNFRLVNQTYVFVKHNI